VSVELGDGDVLRLLQLGLLYRDQVLKSHSQHHACKLSSEWIVKILQNQESSTTKVILGIQ